MRTIAQSAAGLSRVAKLRAAASHNPLATIGVVLIAVFCVLAIFAPLLAPQDPARIDLPTRLLGPSRAHWFGTDELGRDIFSRIIFGARISMLVGVSVVAASLLLGLAIGALAGYYGGGAARLFQFLGSETFLSVSRIPLATPFRAVL